MRSNNNAEQCNNGVAVIATYFMCEKFFQEEMEYNEQEAFDYSLKELRNELFE